MDTYNIGSFLGWLIPTICTVGGAILSLIVWLRKRINQLRESKIELKKVKDEQKKSSDTVSIRNFYLPLISQVETFLNFSGIEKKEWVMNKARVHAIEKNLWFDDGEHSAKIDEVVGVARDVNIKKSKEIEL